MEYVIIYLLTGVILYMLVVWHSVKVGKKDVTLEDLFMILPIATLWPILLWMVFMDWARKNKKTVVIKAYRDKD